MNCTIPTPAGVAGDVRTPKFFFIASSPFLAKTLAMTYIGVQEITNVIAYGFRLQTRKKGTNRRSHAPKAYLTLRARDPLVVFVNGMRNIFSRRGILVVQVHHICLPPAVHLSHLHN